MEKKFPKGELRCAKNESRYKWFVKNQEETIYLSKKEKDLAEKLAVKVLFIQKTRIGNCAFRMLCISAKIATGRRKTEQLLYHPEYRRLLEKYFVPMNEKLKEWQNTPYERCNKHEEALNIKETQGKMLRSKSEAIIDMLLYN